MQERSDFDLYTYIFFKDLLETEGELLEILKKAEKKFERLTAARTPRSSRAIGRQPARSTVTPPSRDENLKYELIITLELKS